MFSFQLFRSVPCKCFARSLPNKIVYAYFPSYIQSKCLSLARSLISLLQLYILVKLWPTVCRPVRLGVRYPSGTRDQFFPPLEISIRQLWVCYFVALSLTRKRVCNLLYNCFWALPEQSLLGRSPAELIFYCLIWDAPNLEGEVPVFISPKEQSGPAIPPGTGFPFCRLLRLVELWWRYSNPPPHGKRNILGW
jgi:hypothetical protein